MSTLITTAKHIPILFSTLMVEALLAGRKTQTRRIIKEIPENTISMHYDEASGYWKAREVTTGHLGGTKNIINNIKCPYGKPGDVLWVRETFGVRPDDKYEYKTEYSPDGLLMKWKPSIHMPKAACRIFLEIVNIRAERLHSITNKDAIAEGIDFDEISIRYYDYLRDCWWECMPASADDLDEEQDSGEVPFPYEPWHSYGSLWALINGAQSWNSNPWVWALEFKQIEKPLNF